MSGERRKFTDCRPQDLEKLFRKLGGFQLSEGGKHAKVTHVASGKMTLIVRHARMNPHIVRDIVEKLLIDELKYPAAVVYDTLDC